MIKSRTKLIVLITLSLLAGIGLAGGLYLVSTPTNLAPRAVAPINQSTNQPINQQITNQLNQQITLTPTPTPSSPLTRQEIISLFGQTTPRADLNADGAVNSLDLAAFDLKNE